MWYCRARAVPAKERARWSEPSRGPFSMPRANIRARVSLARAKVILLSSLAYTENPPPLGLGCNLGLREIRRIQMQTSIIIRPRGRVYTNPFHCRTPLPRERDVQRAPRCPFQSDIPPSRDLQLAHYIYHFFFFFTIFRELKILLVLFSAQLPW